MNYYLLLNLLVAHVLGDFYFQTDSFCEKKFLKSYSGKELWIHAGIIGVLSGIAVRDVCVWAWVLILFITVTHFLVDWGKAWAQKKSHILLKKIEDGNLTRNEGQNSRYDLWAFLIDQVLHIVVIIVGAYYYIHFHENNNRIWVEYQCVQNWFESHPIWAKTSIAMLLAMEPANVLVLLILKFFRVNTSAFNDKRNGSNSHSGKLIGFLERGLILIFVVLSQYEAIGFLVAAKTIRIGASWDIEKSDYVLTGTLLSLAFALLLGLLVIRIPL